MYLHAHERVLVLWASTALHVNAASRIMCSSVYIFLALGKACARKCCSCAVTICSASLHLSYVWASSVTKNAQNFSALTGAVDTWHCEVVHDRVRIVVIMSELTGFYTNALSFVSSVVLSANKLFCHNSQFLPCNRSRLNKFGEHQ